MLKCKLCEFDSNYSLVSHIIRKHNISISEYKKQFVGSVVQKISDKQKNDIRNTLKKYHADDFIKNKMSENMKNGGSWRCKSYWIKRGYTEEEAKHKISEKQQEISKYRKEILPNENILRTEYWIERHNFSEKDAIKKISEMQKERGKNSKRFLGKRRDAEQKRKISISVSKVIERVGKVKWASQDRKSVV